MTEAEKTEGREYLCLVELTYTKMNSGGVEERKRDEVVFKLDEAGAGMPWYVLRNYIVPKYMEDTYGPKEVGWQRVYEIRIIKMVNRDNAGDIVGIPIRAMTGGQLRRYVDRWELGDVPVEEFHSCSLAREMVMLREEDEGAYKRALEKYRSGEGRKYTKLDGMRKTLSSGAGVIETITREEFERLAAGEAEDKTAEAAEKQKITDREGAEYATGKKYGEGSRTGGGDDRRRKRGKKPSGRKTNARSSAKDNTEERGTEGGGEFPGSGAIFSGL